MKHKIAYFTNIAPHYREKLWLAFVEKLNVEFHFFYGFYPKQTIKTIDFDEECWKEYKDQIHHIKNYEVKNRIIFQRKVIREFFSNDWDLIILLGHPSICTTWIASLIARAKGTPLIFWGHGMYGDEPYLKKVITKWFLKIADINLVYGHWAKNLLIKENIDEDKIRVIYNSIDYEISKSIRDKVIIPDFYKYYFKNDLNTLVFIGRLNKVKKIHLLIEAVHKLKTLGKPVNLMIIGDGVERVKLMTLTNQLKISVYFFGACYDETKIGELLANADLCVSPGNVGLTAIHSMSYGTPVCSHNNFNNQGPEFEAIIPGQTGCFFDKKKGNIAETIVEWFNKAPKRKKLRENCYQMVDQHYNPEIQLKVLDKAIKDLLNP